MNTAAISALELVAFPCMLLFTAVALVCDARTQKLPNWLTAPAICAGLLFHAVVGLFYSQFWQEMSFSLGGFGVGFGMLLVLWVVGGAGGGDVKFMGALGSWLGAWLTFQVLVFSALLAVALTLISLIVRSTKKTAWRVPFGVPAAISTWWILALQWAGHGVQWETFTGYFKAG